VVAAHEVAPSQLVRTFRSAAAQVAAGVTTQRLEGSV
jgi:hypothetical protein